LLKLVRYGLTGALVLAALIVLFAVHGSLRYDGFAMLLGSPRDAR
jgi:prepilin signal peptidase PulO-like enzyme (type II secretory pathway)